MSPDPHAGASGTEYQTIRALRELGHQVDEIWSEDLPHRIHHGNLHYLLELPRAYRQAIRRAWLASEYDAVHVNLPQAYLAAIDHERNRRPAVFVNRSHGWETRVRDSLRGWRERRGEPEWPFPRSVAGRLLQGMLARHGRMALAHADGIIASCSACGDFLVSRERLDPRRVAVIAQAAPNEFRHAAPAPMTAERMRKVLYVGQFAFFKGPGVLAEVIDRSCRTGNDITFTWLCHERHHEAVTRTLSVQARRRTTLLGWREQSQLMDVYDQHGIFLFPSFVEGFGKTFLEAMQRGLCVIASDEGGMRDVITDDGDGFLVPPGDATGFTRRLTDLAGDVVAGRALSGKAIQTANRYTWERTAEETVHFYRKLIEIKARVPRQD